MADEKVIMSLEASPAAAAPSASPDGHKRKHEDLELNTPPEPLNDTEPKSDLDSLDNGVQKEVNGGTDESETKRPRLESNGDNVSEADGLVSHNGHQEKEKEDEPIEEDPEELESADDNGQPVDGQEQESSETIVGEPASETIVGEPASETIMREPASETIVGEPASVENDKIDIGSTDKLGQQNTEVEESSERPREGDVPVPSAETQLGSDTEVLSRKMEVPSDKVGVLIGKAGDTIRSLQVNSGAKIQITKDADADPRSTNRPVELIGTLENINKAEKLIKDVIAEADAGGSPSLVARGFSTVQAASGGEQIEIQVSYEKVGLIIGKGGETIRNLQTRSGARIQLIQQNLSDGDQSKDRTVRVTGNKKQIETAREMIRDVMNQVRLYISALYTN
ncbi:hypothetical protein ABFS82_03G122800 [Erythranthe guttata]